ncbi:simple sugar transport system permease protein [Amaricoccus macauensis]|uniref:Simple sugar transport system permease protein n=1 Tax=Amaricoccus macauensis TaxID=57001 RepID=A0A840SJV0_9RHOB|nr:ABC transporter permease [Amaricoccus macauensis]MBB5223399.1 simple sugar transport system permease protein [Amaricoccus macauensis]
MDFDILIQILGATLRVATPILLACLAGLYSERSGIIDIGLDGKMLIAAFASAATAAVVGNVWVALGVAVLASSALALIQGLAAITLRGNQLISGAAINMLALGTAYLLSQTMFGTGGQTPGLGPDQRFMGIELPFHDALGGFYQQVVSGQSVIVYFALATVPLTWWVLYRTRFGLRLRAVGEAPNAVDSAGISVARLRYSAVLIAGALCGVAGAYLATAQAAAYTDGMTANRGFIALAALIFAKWRPYPALGACLLFGFVEAVGYQVQGNLNVDSRVLATLVDFLESSLPYILTVVILAGFVGKATPPAAGGVPYVKER